MTITPMRVPNATNTNDATPITMNLPHFTVQPASASLSSSSWAGVGPAVRMASQTGIRTTVASARGVICALLPRRGRVRSRVVVHWSVEKSILHQELEGGERSDGECSTSRRESCPRYDDLPLPGGGGPPDPNVPRRWTTSASIGDLGLGLGLVEHRLRLRGHARPDRGGRRRGAYRSSSSRASSANVRHSPYQPAPTSRCSVFSSPCAVICGLLFGGNKIALLPPA